MKKKELPKTHKLIDGRRVEIHKIKWIDETTYYCPKEKRFFKSSGIEELKKEVGK